MSPSPPATRRRLLPAVAVGVAALFIAAVGYGVTHSGSGALEALAGCASPQAGETRAPEFAGISDWENSKPLTLASLSPFPGTWRSPSRSISPPIGGIVTGDGRLALTG
ncbi:MAG: hypothetical protein ACYDGR_02195 [Candidatus Dormibacteria bacterium]